MRITVLCRRQQCLKKLSRRRLHAFYVVRCEGIHEQRKTEDTSGRTLDVPPERAEEREMGRWPRLHGLLFMPTSAWPSLRGPVCMTSSSWPRLHGHPFVAPSA
ncbi:uncharacterized protein LOC119577801 [Penaeus monodon]|uniref:uncharacterized protein LOC119577801 n=1 Tax=Penaeus monodon TaxID=6687 RepID=UPI0018A78E99|nr:uncharacterized protein LOC119577801 [Penaeus monodon]